MEWPAISSILFCLPFLLLMVGMVLWRDVHVPRAGCWLLAGIYLAPIPLLLCDARPPGVEITLHGFRFSASPATSAGTQPKASVSFGGQARAEGNVEADHIFLRGAPAGAFQLSASEREFPGDALIRLKRAPVAGLYFMVVDGQMQGRVPLRPGDRIVLPLAGGGEEEVTYGRASLAPLTNAGWIDSSAGRRAITSVTGEYGRPWNLPLVPEGRAPGENMPACLLVEKAPGWRGWAGGVQVAVLLIHPKARVVDAGGKERAPAWALTDEREFSVGQQPVALRFLSLAIGKKGLRWRTSANFARVRFGPPENDRRAAPDLELWLRRPVRQVAELVDWPGELSLNTGVPLKATDTAVPFPGATERLQGAVVCAKLGPASFSYHTAWQRGEGLAFGRPHSPGEGARAIFALQPRGRPWWLAIQLAATGVLVAGFGTKVLSRAIWWRLFGGVAALCGVRLACAWAATVRPPLHDGALWLAGALLTLAPAAILAVAWIAQASENDCANKPGEWRQKLRFLPWLWVAAGVIALLPPWLELQGRPLPGVAIALGAVFVVLGLLVYAIVAGRSLGVWLQGILHTVTSLTWASLLKLAAVLYAIRAIFIGIGWAEAIPLGDAARIQLSVFYVPGYLALCALAIAIYWREWSARAHEDLLLRRLAAAIGMLTLAHLATAVAASDYGLVIYTIPVAILVAFLAVHAWVSANTAVRSHWFLIVPLLLAITFLLWPRGFVDRFETSSRERLFGDDIENPDAVIEGEKQLRLLQYVAPEKLFQLGTIASEKMAQHLAVMEDYRHIGSENRGSGAGFLRVPILHVRATCLSDNAGLVFVLAQFGISGALATLFGYGTLLGVLVRWPGRPQAKGDLRAFGWTLSALAVCNLVMASTYMLVANCLLLPFTGRNMYFLGLNSLGDVLETTALLVLTALGAALASRPESHTKGSGE